MGFGGRRGMDTELLVLITGALAGSLTFGVAGFSFGIVASAIWLQAFAPASIVALVVVIPLVMNLVLLPHFRSHFAWRRTFPFAIGSTLGVPLGALALAHLDADTVRLAIGAVLVAYAVVALRLPGELRVRLPGSLAPAADATVGFVGGVMGGTSGLSIIVPALWWSARGWSKDEQRAIAQPFGMYTHVVTIACFAGLVGIREDTSRLLAWALPFALLGMFLGLKVFRRMSGRGFNRALLWIALLGGALLVARSVRT